MSVVPTAHHHRRPSRPPTEHGASLLIVLAILLIGSLTIAGLLTYTQTSLRNAQSYRQRTERVQVASDAIDLAIAEMRPDLTKGKYGSPDAAVIVTDYPAPDATPRASARCDAQPGSGVGSGDRTVECVSKISGFEVVKVVVQVLDRNGDEPGAEIQVMERSVAG